jgi:hypothetical protein
MQKKRIFSTVYLLCVLTFLFGCGSMTKSAINGDLNGVKSYVAKGENVNQIDSSGWTPLLWATYYNNYPIVEYLLDNGANPNVQSTKAMGDILPGSTALIVAAYYGQTDTVKIILAHSADKNIKNNSGETARYLAEKYSFTEVVDLLDKGVSPAVK